MFRTLVPLAVLMALAVGCKKKGGEAEGDPNATYTIKIRDEQAGDKTEHVETTNGTSEFGGGKGGAFKDEKRFEFSEHIVDQPAGAARPSKLTRAYTVAKKHDWAAKEMKPTKYEGKTVAVEKKGAGYEYTADGKKLDAASAADFNAEFGRGDKRDFNALFAKTAVKVGEPWPIDMAALQAATGGTPFPVDTGKSKMTGTLTKAYTKDGRQWGVIALDFDLVVDSDAAPEQKGKAKGRATGSVGIHGTFEGVIDGSARDGTLKMTTKMDVTGEDGANKMRVAADMTQEKTVRTAK